MTRYSIRFSDGTYGPLVSQEDAERAFARMDPDRRPFCALTCWEEVVEPCGETLRPSAPISGAELIAAVRADPVLDAAFERLGDEIYEEHKARDPMETLDEGAR